MELCDTLEKLFQPYVAAYEQAAMARGQKQEALKIACRLIDLGNTDKEILEDESVTAEELRELRKEMDK